MSRSINIYINLDNAIKFYVVKRMKYLNIVIVVKGDSSIFSRECFLFFLRNQECNFVQENATTTAISLANQLLTRLRRSRECSTQWYIS